MVPGIAGLLRIFNDKSLLLPKQFCALTEIVPLTNPVGNPTVMHVVPAPDRILQPVGVVQV